MCKIVTSPRLGWLKYRSSQRSSLASQPYFPDRTERRRSRSFLQSPGEPRQSSYDGCVLHGSTGAGIVSVAMGQLLLQPSMFGLVTYLLKPSA